MDADILVLEADPCAGVEIRRGLESADYTVDLVGDGITAVRLVGRHSYRAVLMDISELGSNRHRVCVELRRSRVDVPILIVAEKGGEDDEVEALDSGADDYLRKPYSNEVLLARLRALTRRGSRAADRMLRIGDLWLDLTRHRCGRGRQEISLTGREFAVLAQLAQRPGHVVSKALILDEVWDMACEVTPAIVEVYISALRRKIDVPFGVCSIETVRGSGYRLVAVVR